MNIAVIGLGSMGKRRIRLLKGMSDDFSIVGVDEKPDRRLNAEKDFSIKTYERLGDALSETHPECAVVSASPLSHSSIIRECLKNDCHVFTELNLVSDGYEENIRLAAKKDKVLFLSSTFLYRDEIRHIRKRTGQANEGLNYIYHVGQYLPDWHPWEAVQDYFVSDKRTNGCRELFAIELPWLIKAFGKIEGFEVLSGKNTALPLDYDDNYLLLLRHENGNKGMLAVDVVSRKAVRNLEVYGEGLYIAWDGTPEGLREYDIEQRELRTVGLSGSYEHLDSYASFVIENAYRNELEAFMKEVNGESAAEYTFEEDLGVLSLIDRIEKGNGS